MPEAEQHLTTPSTTDARQSWRVYHGLGTPRDDWELPPAPPWRQFDGVSIGQIPRLQPGNTDAAGARAASGAVSRRPGQHRLAERYRAEPREARLVNAAICLRRPLLVTGKPGTGKSTLAHSIAFELGLGPVLSWPITSRSTLQEGLYRYDAIGRLQEVNLRLAHGESADGERQAASRPEDEKEGWSKPDIGSFLQLGPLGTALLPRDRPRVLLIDEIDKSDIDLPNDLLTIFEEGEFMIPELTRLPEDQQEVAIMTADQSYRELVRGGQVRCGEFPVIVLTSNGERDFPPAFLRRCIRLDITPPSYEKLARIVAAHLGDDPLARSADVVQEFINIRETGGELAADQLLNALYMVSSGSRAADPELDALVSDLLRPLNTDD
jgi:MoxR-like ATPase